MKHPRSALNTTAIAWALLSQTIWAPLLIVDAIDNWQARVKALTPPTNPATASAPKPVAVPPTRLATAAPLPSLGEDALGVRQAPSRPSVANGAVRSGLLLNDRPSAPSLSLPTPLLSNLRRAVSTPLQAVLSLASPTRWLPSAPASPRDRATAAETARWQGPPIPTAGGDLLMRTFTRSELLGGTLSLGDIDNAPISAVALAERARWAGSADPLAPLPALWRDPMRRALGQIPGSATRVEQARMVHVPSRRVSRPTEVPLALQSDGSVDILSRPDDPGVVREIEEWSTRQQPPGRGGVLPAVVLLHPVSEASSLAPAAAIPLPIVSESEPAHRSSATSATTRARSTPSKPAGWEGVAPSAPISQPEAASTPAAPEAAPVMPQPVAEAAPPPPAAEPAFVDPVPVAAPAAAPAAEAPANP